MNQMSANQRMFLMGFFSGIVTQIIIVKIVMGAV